MGQSAELKGFWDKKLSKMPRKQVQANLKEAGFNFPLGSLSDDELRKVFYGLLTKLDEGQQHAVLEDLNRR